MNTFTRLGKYQIRRELGKGAMGVVYEGFDPLIERTVAIKTILPQQLKGEDAAQVMARFKREAQAAGRLNHPGIVAVYDYGEEIADDDNTMMAGQAALAQQRVAYIAMEFVQGRELRDFFEQGERFALPEIDRLMGEILEALGHAHAHGVVHRDIKPANLIVLGDGRVKIADFGIARMEKSELTQVGTIMGTPAYMSPEQFMGQPVDARSDLFSCGVVLYQFLTGEKPFTGNSTTIMFKVLHEEPLAPSMLNVSLPAAFDQVVRKAMAKNPLERFQSAQEFLSAMRTALRADAAQSLPAAAPAANADDPERTNVSVAPAPIETAHRARQRAAAALPQAGTEAATMPAPLAASTAPTAPATTVPVAPKGRRGALLGAAAATGTVLVAVGLWWQRGASAPPPAPAASVAMTTDTSRAAAATPATATQAAAPTPEPALQAGTLVISALGLADPKDPRFANDAAAARAAARADAQRHLVEKALALYVQPASLRQHRALLDRNVLAQPAHFIQTVIQEGATHETGGMFETETRAVVKVREVQKSLNALSRQERIEFIRQHGDPKVALNIRVRNADSGQTLGAERSMLAENVLKERIKSFGFRVWSSDATPANEGKAGAANFHIDGEVKVKTLSARLPASGLTITKTALTSWTIRATDKASGEEVYLNTVHPSGKSWADEDQALAEIGKLVGDAFSRQFFLEHFQYDAQSVVLRIAGLPDTISAQALLRELRSFARVLDAEPLQSIGHFRLRLAPGDAAAWIQTDMLGAINEKLGRPCLAMSSTTATEVLAKFDTACAPGDTRARLDSEVPAGLAPAYGTRAVSKPPTT